MHNTMADFRYLMLCLVSVVDVCIEQQGIQRPRAVQFSKTWARCAIHCDDQSENNGERKRGICQHRLAGDAFSGPDDEGRSST